MSGEAGPQQHQQTAGQQQFCADEVLLLVTEACTGAERDLGLMVSLLRKHLCMMCMLVSMHGLPPAQS